MTTPFSSPVPPARPKVPKWLKITLGVLGGLWVISVVFGESTDEQADPAAQQQPIAAPTTTFTETTESVAPTTVDAPAPAPTTTTTTRRAPDVYRVDDVVDGDTVKVTRLAGGGLITVRVLGIDAPETKDPHRGVGCFGPQASAWAVQILAGQRVTLRTDASQDTRDRYGRLLAYVILPNGKDYSTEAARAGYAKYYLYNTPVSRSAQIQAAQRSARSAGKGLWGAPCYGDTSAAVVRTQPAPQPVAPRPAQPDSESSSAYYQNCDAARAAGAAPLRRGEAGYRSGLDRDNDGVACEG